MAKIIENEKGFRVIEITSEEMRRIHPEMHGEDWFPICDNCGRRGLKKGMYVSVLNRWLCPKCYEEWYSGAVRYQEYARIEERNFNTYKNMLGL